jgi:hypothetical protein
MGDEYGVKINRREGALEIVGPDKEWVDAKVEQLSSYLSQPVPVASDDDGDAGRTSAGSGTAQGVQQRKSAKDGAKKNVERPRKRGRPTINEELRGQLKGDTAKELQQYIADRRAAWDSSKTAQAAIIAGFLHEHLDIEGVDMHDLYTVYSVLGERPGNTRSQLVNARQRTSYFGGMVDGKVPLSIAGDNFAKFDSLDSAGES